MALGINEVILMAVTFVAAGAMLALYAGRKNPVSTYATHALCGFIGLAAVSLTTGLTGVTLGVNFFTCVITALLGLPGVATMVGLSFIWAI